MSVRERFSFLQIHPISYPRGVCKSGTFPHVVSRLERVLPELGPFDLRLNDLDPLAVAAFSRVDEELTEGRHNEVPREVGALLLGLGLVVLALLLQRLHEHLAVLEEHVVDGHEGPEVCKKRKKKEKNGGDTKKKSYLPFFHNEDRALPWST